MLLHDRIGVTTRRTGVTTRRTGVTTRRTGITTRPYRCYYTSVQMLLHVRTQIQCDRLVEITEVVVNGRRSGAAAAASGVADGETAEHGEDDGHRQLHDRRQRTTTAVQHLLVEHGKELLDPEWWTPVEAQLCTCMQATYCVHACMHTFTHMIPTSSHHVDANSQPNIYL